MPRLGQEQLMTKAGRRRQLAAFNTISEINSWARIGMRCPAQLVTPWIDFKRGRPALTLCAGY
jgi:hypothetical protein